MPGKITTRLACAVLAATFVTTIDIPDAEAQRRTLLEQWFANAAEKQRQRRLKRLRRTNPELFINERKPATAKPVPIQKVKGPQYYNYVPETLVTLALANALPEIKIIVPVDANALLGEDDTGADALPVIDAASTGAIEDAPHVLRGEALKGWTLKVEAGISKALKAHYSKSPDYLWVNREFQPTKPALEILAAFKRAEEFGLASSDYSVSEITSESVEQLGAEKAGAKFELELSAAILRYGADAKDGRINPNGLSGYHDFPRYKRDYGSVASKVFGTEDASNVLEGLHPSNKAFASLISELAELRTEAKENSLDPVALGTFFKPGQEHEELPKVIALVEKKASDALREKHSDTFAAYDDRILFDEPLVALVRDFQKENGLGPDGIVGKKTVAKLTLASPKAKIAKIELAMERLRWHPESFGSRHVFINQPAYRASYMVDGKPQLSMRAIVGKPSNQTYFFNDKIEIVEVNPYWNVPRSIMINQKLKKIRANPGYLSKNGFEVLTAKGVTDPYSVNWNSDSLKGVQIRQKPGRANALGELKILFPNKHAIYMHDTPARSLFDRSSRAYSSGCIRLHKPRAMAAAVLGTSVDYVSKQIATGKNKSMAVKNKIPVYVSYFTAWPNSEGKVRYYADIYGRDKALTKALDKTSKLRNSIADTGS